MPSPLKLAGKRFTRLAVVRRDGCDRHGNAMWICRCDCGKETRVTSGSLTRKNSQSCGCLIGDTHRTHGCWSHPLFKIWGAMMDRCYNPKCPQYKDYGARGIRVAERWHDPRNFIADMPPRPSKRHGIDRYPNNDGDYEPGNVRWATQEEQMRNTRANRMIHFRGEVHCLAEWADILGINYKALHRRLTIGWSVRKAFTTPLWSYLNERPNAG